ncbi:MAG: N-acetylmuramoyl-L-alanine amidase [Kiritimatiellae bacterium]|nr:N-acetylmuramoyl-L-alanine amidase [Kiritimatiellia bacterium]MDD5521407.1 N-acetylmuramoyl-L-alanine amidase [Kiritimatiellia bacterium]
MDITNYLSPWNRERPVRSATYYIVLHTTEGFNSGSIRKIHANGEAHYFLDTAGRVSRIIEEKRLALHAGRSVWDGRQDVDRFSIGIEVVGNYNKDITQAQYRSLRELLAIIQEKYKIPDDRVLTHSMVAYGAPNSWHKKAHRGRKRCGMLFAGESVRQRLGLDKKPSNDPDVKSGRVVVGDPYLAQVLYGKSEEQKKAVVRYTSEDANVISHTRSAWDIAGDRYKSESVVYHFPDGKERRGNEVRDWKKMPVGTKVFLSEEEKDDEAENILEIGVDGANSREVAGEEYNSKTTIYFLPDGHIMQGDEIGENELSSLPEKTKVLVGYKYGGKVTAKRSAFEICGKAWNFPSTYYRLPDSSITPGNRLNEGQIPKNAVVFFRN